MFSLLTLALMAVVAGFVLAMFITRQKLPAGTQTALPEDDALSDSTQDRQLTRQDLYHLAGALCAEHQLTVVEKVDQSEIEAYWIAKSTNTFFYGNYILGFYETSAGEPLVTLAKILEFKDFVKSAGSRKGFVLTNGFFSKDVHQPLEGPELTLYNRRKVLAELKSRGLL